MARVLKLEGQNFTIMEEQFYQTLEPGNKNSPVLQPKEGTAAKRTMINSKTFALSQKIERYARSNYHVLLTGERGTGKTTIAREIHLKSPRRSKQFVSLNCATLQAELVEAELFGYEKGSFTGANQMKPGLFETGSGGTIFLDEVGELSLNLQAKLLKAVEEKQIRRVGASREIPVDLRIIAATSRNLPAMVANGEFRADLYDRLNVLNLNTIPLREQRERISEIVIDGLERERITVGRKINFQIEPAALTRLRNYPWTGNFRELHNFVLKLTIEFCEAEIITENDIRVLLASKDKVMTSADQIVLNINLEEPLDRILERVKEEYIGHHLKDKSFRRTSRHCGISLSMIRRIAYKFETSNRQDYL